MKWVAREGPDQGKAKVTIDGLTKCVCDLYSARVQTNAQLDFGSGSSATHTLVLRVLGTKSAGSRDANVAVDAFVVGGATVQDDSPKIQYNNWKGSSFKSSSGGTFRTNDTARAFAKFTFEGTSVEWLTAKGPAYGNANMFVDGATKATYNLYAPKVQWQAVVPFAGLSAGQHTIEIRPVGTKPVVVDAFRGRVMPVGVVTLSNDAAGEDGCWLFMTLALGLIALWIARLQS